MIKGIVLAGGNGSRLYPLTLGISKQLLPIYNKPMIYYSLSVLMLSDIREILIITRPDDLPLFQRTIGDGSQFGLSLSYAIQKKPRGIAEAFLIGEKFIGNSSVCLILGDNLFFGNQLCPLLEKATAKKEGATLFGYPVKDPKRYGVIELNSEGIPLSLIEKPEKPKSNIAVTGLYFYDNQVVEIARTLTPSARNELEITDINRIYIGNKQASINVLGRGFTWLDAGTYESLMQASHFVQVIEERQGHCIAALEEIAFNKQWITQKELEYAADKYKQTSYGEYLKGLSYDRYTATPA